MAIITSHPKQITMWINFFMVEVMMGILRLNCLKFMELKYDQIKIISWKKNTETKRKNGKRQKKKPKRIAKRMATPGFTGVTVRLAMRLELQIGEIPLRFSGISLFGPGAQALAKSLGSWLNGENLHL